LTVECKESKVESTAEEVQRIMRQASELVLPGFPLATVYTPIRYPDRYQLKKGKGDVMWRWVEQTLGLAG
jgi:hypothetical protein